MSTERRPERRRPSIRRFLDMKRAGEPIVALTAYDVITAGLVDAAGADLVLVGDSLGQVVLGYDTTQPVTLEEMIHHARAVRRGAPDAFVVLDMPFLTYQVDAASALRNAGRAVKEAGVHAVKVEGGGAGTLAAVSAIVEAGVPVMGHVGLTPQSVHALGGYRVQGRSEEDAERLSREAHALEDAGAFAVVLELVPAPLAGDISRSLQIPTIGIGAGPECDGQVLVVYDVLGLNPGFRPRFLKRFGELHELALQALRTFAREVREGAYPDAEHSFGTGDAER